MMSVEQLVQCAADAGAESIAMNDINNSTAIPGFAGECIKKGIKPLAGIEFRNRNDFLYICIAANNEGLKELNEFLSFHNLEKTPLPFPAPEFSNAYTIYRLSGIPARPLFGNERIGIRPSEINSLMTTRNSAARNSMVLLQPVTFASEDDIFAHKSLRAADNNILLSHLKASMCAGEDEIIMTPEKKDYLFREHRWLMNNTVKLMNDCSLNFDLKTPKNKKVFSASRYDDRLLLEKLAWDVWHTGTAGITRKRKKG